MDNPEEILHSLEEFSKMKPKDIPRELEEYLCFVAKTGDPVYQWSSIKSLFREKLINVITEFYETCPTVEIPPCPNVELFNYDTMKNFILEKLDTFAAAPFTVQRICELLTTPRKEYNRIDKYMRALEKNILVVSTTEPGGNRRNAENGDGIVNGLESEHVDNSSTSNDINVEEMDDTPAWPPRGLHANTSNYPNSDSTGIIVEPQNQNSPQETFVTESKMSDNTPCSSSADTVITCRPSDQPYVSIEPVASDSCSRQENVQDSDVTVTITAIPPTVQNQKSNEEETVASSDPCTPETTENTREVDNELETRTVKLEEAETSTTDESKEGADSTTQKHGDLIEKETDEDSQVASTSSETTSSETSPESEESNVESERDYNATSPDKETTSTEAIASSVDILADTTKLKDDQDDPEETVSVESSSEVENVDSLKEAVISSSDEVTSELSTTEENLENPDEGDKSELKQTQIDANEHLENVPEVSDSTSSNTQTMEVDISDDTTQDTATTTPDVDADADADVSL